MSNVIPEVGMEVEYSYANRNATSLTKIAKVSKDKKWFIHHNSTSAWPSKYLVRSGEKVIFNKEIGIGDYCSWVVPQDWVQF
jgi:hypothetical protein